MTAIAPRGEGSDTMFSTMVRILAHCGVAAALTYGSLVVPGSVSAECSNLGTAVFCPVLAYGFPLPFVADSQGISPVGSVARDPLSLLIGEDDVLWPRLGVSTLFWLVVVTLGRLAWRRVRQPCALDRSM